MYLRRNTLHHELQLPDGYGLLSICVIHLHIYSYLLYSEQRITGQGQVYFIHRETGVSTWHDPRFR